MTKPARPRGQPKSEIERSSLRPDTWDGRDHGRRPTAGMARANARRPRGDIGLSGDPIDHAADPRRRTAVLALEAVVVAFD